MDHLNDEPVALGADHSGTTQPAEHELDSHHNDGAQGPDVVAEDTQVSGVHI
jgi:hypothetical protein